MTDVWQTRCKCCGQEIIVFSWGIWNRAECDPEVIYVTADAAGEDFVRFGGSKIKGREVAVDSIEPNEPAYRMHRRSCKGKKK